MESGRLKKVASALAKQPALLSKILNDGLGGNRVLKTRVQNGRVNILRRKKPEDEFVATHHISAEGEIVSNAGEPVKNNADKFLEKAIPLIVVANVEALTVPETDEMMKVYLNATEHPDYVSQKQRLNRLGMSDNLRRSAEGLSTLLKDVTIETLAETFALHSQGELDFRRFGDKFLMLTRSGSPLAVVDINGYADANSIVAAETMNAVLRSSVATLDAAMDLVNRAASRQEVERRLAKVRWERKAAEREKREREVLISRVERMNAKAGDIIILNNPDFDDYGYRCLRPELVIAERNLGLPEFLALMDGQREGLVSLFEPPEFSLTEGAREDIQRYLALDRSAESDEDVRPG